MGKAPNVKHVLKWALPGRAGYLGGMSSSGPVLVRSRERAMVFNSKPEARMHPANLVPGCSFEPVLAKPPRRRVEKVTPRDEPSDLHAEPQEVAHT